MYRRIDFLSGCTRVGLPAGVAAGRGHDLKGHRKQMMGMFTGAMLIAGLFTFLPGWPLWTLFFAI